MCQDVLGNSWVADGHKFLFPMFYKYVLTKMHEFLI